MRKAEDMKIVKCAGACGRNSKLHTCSLYGLPHCNNCCVVLQNLEPTLDQLDERRLIVEYLVQCANLQQGKGPYRGADPRYESILGLAEDIERGVHITGKRS